jgi:hypothetical protein
MKLRPEEQQASTPPRIQAKQANETKPRRFRIVHR